ncbi:Tetratricopeptide TPR_1 repeat-containing protein [Emticicia oligotrophica DSM 17448]|uniref:Tetratricopeptide TPR_1 repeat-containing protein n=1 Tax=Emticicia oligotrophica (strain DSM 17448 / CIP 109782 / MTCC 6937 / GPTSA100-15) TaxID=929562 RepID=A0ABN4ARX8_EMTOG|nr:tetratricopeptide repeat protein [Emticicia oligotrophica]AFK05333.1 Tetratricopeptide TPR_1 repeat-containing protein [Emticicia oligotrophica DSM 17448]
MKKIILASVMTAIATGVYAQAGIDAQLKDAQCKSATDNIAKAEKATQDPKKGVKSASWVKLAESYLEMATNCGKDSLASKKAFETYQKALEIEKAAGGKGLKDIEKASTGTTSSLYTALMQQGAGFYNAKNFKNALDLFKLASNTSPKDTMSALYAGIVAQQSQDMENAKTYFGKFIDEGGKDIAVFYGLSELYRGDKDYAKAIEVLKKGIAANPKDKDLQSSLINVYLNGNMMNEAIEMMKQRIAGTPNNAENAKTLAEDYKNLGTLYENGASEFEKKIRPIESEILGTAKEKADAEKELASVEGKKSAQEDELKRLTDRLKKEPKNAASIKNSIASVNQMIASASAEVSSVKQKIEKLTQAAQGNAQKEAELVSLRAKDSELKGMAVANYKKALEIDPSNFDANYNLGVYYFNSAVVIKGQVDRMDMKTYNEKGKAIEEQVCGTFNEAKTYFDKCKSLKSDDQDTIANLENLKGVLEQCSKRK